VSRFLAKAALETMADRLVEYPAGLAYLVEESQLDPVRHYARRGSGPEWPYHIRRIYDSQQAWMNEAQDVRQIKWESDFLVTENGEWFYVLALFGLELAINLGGPDIAGYVEWLWRNAHRSPLYSGRNGAVPLRPVQGMHHCQACSPPQKMAILLAR
jgi:hypothetical protein